MRVSLKWLNEYVETPSDIQALCDRFDLSGTGVEGIEEVGDIYKNVVTAQVVAKEAHPTSNNPLWVCQVDVGTYNLDDQGKPTPIQIVCGAQNFNQGDHIVTALTGAVLPGDFKIKKSKLAGVTSNGMNCSQRELGLGQEYDGIWILPQDAPVGVPLAEYLGLSDTILDLEITPNRPDCLSMVGMAREVGAMLQADVSYPSKELVCNETPVESLCSVQVEDPARCARYTARVIQNVKIGPSPQWLVERIEACGARSINNVVDITNYIMFLFGQPLHAFDFDKLASGKEQAEIIVRPAQQAEKLTTLDGVERELTPDMTVIATPQCAVALAGVMGGLETEVSDETTTVLLEAATFDHAHTSRTSRNLGLISESSMRYERVVDDNPIADISAYAAALIAELCGGSVCEGIVDIYTKKTEPTELELRIERCNKMLGLELSPAEITDILVRLGCEVHAVSDTLLKVTAPTYRPDLEREIDLYEEVLRLYGMDRVEPSLPASPARVGSRSLKAQRLDLLHNALRASGLNETMNYSFANPADIDRLRLSHEGLGDAVELLNPMNVEQSSLRQSLIPGLLQSAAHNLAHGVKNIQLYEVGATFHAAAGKKQPKEKERVAGIFVGAMNDAAWNKPAVAFDFFDAKGAVESLARELAIPKLRFKSLEAKDAEHLQPGRAAEVLSGGTILGWVGEIHPRACADFEIEVPVAAFELDLSSLLKSSQPARPYQDIPQFPAVVIDVAFVVDTQITHEKISQCIGSAGGKLLEDIQLFDVYESEEHLGANKKSLAYKLTYRAQDRTLTSEEVKKAHERLIKKVCAATSAEVRG